MSLRGQKVIVFGGSSGIGLSVAELVAKEGAHVIIASRSREKLERAARSIEGEVSLHTVDMTEEKSVRDFFAEVGAFDHLVNTAADGPKGKFLELETTQAKVMMESKYWGQYHTAKFGAPLLNKGGSITFTTGVLSRKPMVGTSILSAVNGGLEGLTRALAFELQPIRVNAVSPGIVKTPLYDGMSEADRERYFSETAEALPVGKVAEARDIAEAYLYLMKNSFSTGTVLHVDGGHPLM
ncbi:NAD(P)-dependent dehydrogenase, short-chain alcohol dehydrogenase family [Marininema mesophilum]|uniref:NAD(P)-dependent dehydrogenase, short-chain alcohol dehydrogenase family n=1 Tax=Marininema mesophilum TaxID=1048340 RepID=A0A1H2Z5C4_9BACL|nr:SDR family oxidoreductase [Marininema mesophilum]SDX12673.1 NAD(P)-dependent dehydrogenase, short-chain alcohol dehydrogenase family [Marininema mesophilum]